MKTRVSGATGGNLRVRWLTLAVTLGAGSAALPLAPAPLVAQMPAQYYAAPGGRSSADGSLSDPWDLATALNSNARGVKGGDTIWLRGGWYAGTFTSSLAGTANAPIVVRSFPGERATIDRSRGQPYIDALYVTGSYTWYWGFEITDLDSRRTTLDVGSFPADLPRWNGIYTTAPNNKFINLVVHDLANGVTVYAGENTEVSGSIIYFNGWEAPDRGHGHGIYTQNSSGTRLISDNVIFDQLSHGFHAYGSGAAALNNIQLVGNTIFNNGILTLQNQYYDRNILLGGGVLAQNPVVSDNYTYYSQATQHNRGGENNIGYAAGCTNLQASGNYFAHFVKPALVLVNCAGNVVNNTFIGTGHSSLAAYPQNTFLSARPTSGTQVFVRPNRYETGRSNVTVFNWDNLPLVNVSLAGTGLVNGDHYQIKDAQNFYGPPVATGIYSSAPVAIPMSNLTAVTPIGIGVTVPPHTPSEFGAFVVMPGTSGTVIDYPTPPPPPLPSNIEFTYVGETRDAVGPSSRAVTPDGIPDGAFQLNFAALSGTKTVDRLELKLANNGGLWNTVNNGYRVAGVATSYAGSLLNAADGSIRFDVNNSTQLYVFAANHPGASVFTTGSLWFANVFFTDGTMAAGHGSIDANTPPPPPLPPPSTTPNRLTFVKADSTTQGTWKGVYGSDGYSVADDSSSYPSYAHVTFAQQSTWTWLPSTTSVRALQKGSTAADRLASCWYSTGSFTIDIDVGSAASRRIAIYNLDWDPAGRQQLIDIFDGTTGALLDSRTVAAFSGGQYLVWDLTGRVTIRVTRTGPNSSAISGLFFDPSPIQAPPPNLPPTVNMTGPNAGATFVAPASVLLLASASDSDGTVSSVLFYQGASLIGTGTWNGTAYGLAWTGVAAGTYVVTAQATDNSAASTSSQPLTVTVATPPNVPPTVAVTSPQPNATFVAPGSVALAAQAGDSDGTVTTVQFFQGAALLGSGTLNGAAYTLSWPNVPAGTYSLSAKATDNRGAVTTSAPINISVSPPPPPAAPPPPSPATATAVFVKSDSATQGSWTAVYGTEGYGLASLSSAYPSYAQVTIGGQQSWTWMDTTTAVQAVEKPSVPDRIAACWYSNSVFTIDVNITDGATHQLALYALDWDNAGRSETVDMLDGTTGVVLDRRTISQFASGQYRVWRVGGHITIRITRAGANSSAVSALFFDPASPTAPVPSVTLTSPSTPISLTAPASLTLAATASVVGGSIAQLSFLAGASPIGTSTNTSSPFTYQWSNIQAGTYAVTAKAVAAGTGATANSAPIIVTVKNPSSPGSTSATFIRTDSTTLGTWRGVYGRDGYVIANDVASIPSYARVAVSGQLSWTWQQNTTEARALQKGGSGVGRIAACWYSGSTFTIDIDITDGATHQLALHAMDWDSVGRQQTIEIRNASTGAVLNALSLGGYQNGRYLVWRISGHVQVRVTRTGASSGLLSAMFFDPAF